MNICRPIIAFALGLCALTATVPASATTTCDQAVANCQIEGANKPNIVEKCQAAGVACHKTGRFVGPITGRDWKKNIRRE
jgi:hypothetical protein